MKKKQLLQIEINLKNVLYTINGVRFFAVQLHIRSHENMHVAVPIMIRAYTKKYHCSMEQKTIHCRGETGANL